MPKTDPKVLLRKASDYLKAHPEEIARAVRGALGLRLGVPIDALRYLAREFDGGKKAPRDVVLEAAPPGLRASMTVDVMKTPLRVSLVVFVEELDVQPEAVLIGLRIADLKLDVLSEEDSPLAGLLRSGALDLSKPGNLVNIMPKRPAALVAASDDRVTLDLMKVRKIAANPAVSRTLRIMTPVLGVRALKTKDDHLDLHLRATPAGFRAALEAMRQQEAERDPSGTEREVV
ncbi:hypothetical protein [Chondromyces crocatus]|uniref:Uncharacterized protein n=1 Tax=Chondromyces crocatus TaxID=52 RepID=A0A0K1EH70_CHOCO|nr:hypothetical protein [Chondromyces crocatus]AKT40211.1 uncharacterized protein CMC5_043640 [Chondromyces crocatus]